MEDEEDYVKLPVEERCVHKVWKARVSGYEEAIKLFNRWDGDESSWKKYHGQIKKFVVDSNAIAQEKGLEAALAYVENCDNADKTVSDVMDGLVLKCVAAPKAKTKDLAKQITLMFCEIETFEKVIEVLTGGLAQKNPKVVSGCINNMTACLHAFGAKVIKVSPLLKAIVPLLDHRDKTVREEGKALIVEAYRWVGDVMKQQLTGLKPVQLTDLETEFAKSSGEKAKPERLLRSQQQVGNVESGADNADNPEANANDNEEEGDDDPFDLLDPVDILEKLPKNFYELVEEKKWQLRKEALDALLPLTQSPKISPNGDYGDLTRVLKKFIGKDTNVMLVTLAAQCLTGLAKGLRGSFKNGAANCLSTILEKFKEKKPTVVAALNDAADALYPPLGIEAIQEDCLAALKHKTPTVISGTSKFVARCYAKVPPQVVSNKKMVKGYVSALLDTLNHSDPGVRESSSEALGVLMKILGEPAMSKMMPDLEAIKLAKVKEHCDKTVLTGKIPKAPAPASSPTKSAPGNVKTVKSKGASNAKKVVKPVSATKPDPVRNEDADIQDDFTETPSAPAPAASNVRKTSSAPPRRTGLVLKPGSGARKTSVTSASAASRKKSEDVDTGPPYKNMMNLKNQRFKDEQKLKILKWHFSTPRPEFVDQLKEQMTNANFNVTLMTQMFHADFKQHLKAIDTLRNYIGSDIDGLIANLDLILKWSTLRFFETNPSVLLKALEYLNDVFAILSQESYNLHDIEAVSFIPYLVNKVGDPKDQVRYGIRSIFRQARTIYPVGKFCPFILEGMKAKNAKQRAECLDELGSMISDFGLTVLQPNVGSSIKEIAKQIADRDNSVRNAALNAVIEAYFKVGEKLYKMIGNLPERDMAMLEERIKRVSKTRPPPESGAPAAQDPVPPPRQSQPSSRSNPSTPSSGLPRPGSSRAKVGGIPSPSTSTSGLRRYQPQSNKKPESSSSGLLRPKTSPASNGGGIPRPKSGIFALDLEKIENDALYESNANQGPQLVNHNIDDILQDEPVVMPSSKSTSRLSLSLSQPDPIEELDLILSQLSSKDDNQCISALSKLDELIKDPQRVHLIGQRMDQLLSACYMQYHNVLTQKLKIADNDREVLRLLQFVTMILMSTYHHSDITKNASGPALHDIFHIIVTLLLEPKIEQLPDGTQLVRALNVLTVKIIDRSNHTNVTSAIIKLLSDSVALSASNPKFVDIVMKCIWKIIRLLPVWMDDLTSNPLDASVTLKNIDDFLKAYPSLFWKSQESDTPLRTVKTILHTMVKVRGESILDHLTLIEDLQSSEMLAYLHKLLGSGKQTTSNGNGVHKQSSGKIQLFSKSEHEIIAEIFKKIGQKELTQEGLHDLYNFKKDNPEADLEPFLDKSSDYFRSYIERGLEAIEAENQTGSHVAEKSAASLYMDRLKRLRSQGGLDSASPTTTSTVSAYRIAMNNNNNNGSTVETTKRGSVTTVTLTSNFENHTGSASADMSVDDIRRRLARLRQAN